MPSSNRRTRERQLAKLAERRRQQRRRQQRRRYLTIGVALAIAAAGLGVLGFAVLGGGKPKPVASPTPKPTPTAQPVACGGKVPVAASVPKQTYPSAPPMTISDKKTYVASFLTSCGTFEVTFDPKTSPNTVNSLVFLIQHHFYDGLTFHRIAKNFVIQGGDPKGDGSGGPGYSTVDTPPKDANYPIGTIAMAKTGNAPPGTSGSQFFVVTADGADGSLAPNGVGQYAIVGHVTKGLDVIQKIAALDLKNGSQDGPPIDKVYIVQVSLKIS
jgi:cyclophilin family peptidyl-prolyl cis-trans isomerase